MFVKVLKSSLKVKADNLKSSRAGENIRKLIYIMIVGFVFSFYSVCSVR